MSKRLESVSPSLEGNLEGEGSGCSISVLEFLLICALIGVLGAVMIPGYIPRGSGGSFTACKSNLKNMGTAMEMYSTDWSGKYPTDIRHQLTPNYLKTMPECPMSGTDTYMMLSGESAPYNTGSYADYYFIYCEGSGHKPLSVPENYPQYNGIVGLIER